METKQVKAKVLVGLLALVGLVGLCPLALAGDLEPSGPPAPTMKTLDEVEPRVPIHASDLPLTITEANSYYLVEDVNSTDTANHAITINSNDVTIDLMGYTLKGPDSGTKSGIYMSDRSNVEIRNGTVRGFDYGIRGIGFSSQDRRVIDVRSVSNGKSGIYLNGKGHLVKGCTVSDNGTSAAGSVYGIYTGTRSTVTGNTACDNGNSASSVWGIFAGYGSTVTGNTANNNGFLAGNNVNGISAGGGCTVTGNTACDNGDNATNVGCTVNGIRTSGGSTVTGNTAYHNGTGADGTVYGIYLSEDSLVAQNTAYDNGGTNMRVCASCTFGTNHAP